MATCNLYHDQRRSREDGLFPIKFRITYDRKSKYIDTGFYVDDTDFQKNRTGNRLDPKLKRYRDRLSELIKKAEDVIEGLECFTFEVFVRRFKNAGDRSDLINLIMEKVMLLEEEESYSNARLYRQAAVLLAKFNLERYKSEKLLLRNLTPDFLRAFQKWALCTNYIVDKKKTAKPRTYSVTTIGMYLIRIKAIVNGCVDAGELPQARNPFGKKKYTIPKSRAAKRPLELSEIKLLANYQTEDKREQFARDIFIFSYLANGMNFYDIFKLKWSDIRNEEFRFVRQKTFSKLPDKQIRVFLNEKLISIIERHGTDKNQNGYIFDVVPWGASKMEEEKRIRSVIATVNPQLKKIANIIGINPEISTYYARHSFATIMHELGASIITLKNVIGHEDIKSTQVYIGYDRKERLIELQNRLLED